MPDTFHPLSWVGLTENWTGPRSCCCETSALMPPLPSSSLTDIRTNKAIVVIFCPYPSEFPLPLLPPSLYPPPPPPSASFLARSASVPLPMPCHGEFDWSVTVPASRHPDTSLGADREDFAKTEAQLKIPWRKGGVCVCVCVCVCVEGGRQQILEFSGWWIRNFTFLVCQKDICMLSDAHGLGFESSQCCALY